MEPEENTEELSHLTDRALQSEMDAASAYVQSKFIESKTARFADEQRWLEAYRNFRGIYGPDTQFTETEKSRVFIRLTKTKVLAAYQQLIDVLFGGNKFPLSIEPTVIPEGVMEAIHFSPEEPEGAGGLMDLKPGETIDDLLSRIGPIKDKIGPVKEKIKPGEGTRPGDVTYHPALVAAKNYEKRIHDALVESDSNKNLRYAAFEAALFGTGMMEGPFAIEKTYPRWVEGKYDPVIKTVPKVSNVSVWDYYNDPEAYSMEESEYGIRRRKYTKAGLRALKRQEYFIRSKIDEAIECGPNYNEEWWEDHMQDNTVTGAHNRYEVLEFWGYIDGEELDSFGLPELDGDSEDFVVNIWVCNGKVIRATAANYEAFKIPFYRVPYELNPYSFWGIGVAENMKDSQELTNGFWRMAIDNAALSGNLVFDIDEDALVPGQDMKVYPGKIFRRQSGAPGQAVVGIKFPNVSNENMQMYDKARVLADESTGITSYSHGQTGVTGIGRTAAGISMLMDASGGAIKSVVKNFDDYLLAPMGKAMFDFIKELEAGMNIEYDGDLEVKARGTDSFVATEVRSQRLLQFLQITQAPNLAPFPKIDYLIREIAKSLDLDPDKTVNNMADAAIQAEILKKLNPEPQQEMPVEGAPPPTDTAGGANGNIGVGSAPPPGAPGFSGNGEAGGIPPEAMPQ